MHMFFSCFKRIQNHRIPPLQADAKGFFNRKVLKSPTKTQGEAVSRQKYSYKHTAREMFSSKKWKYTIYVNPNSAQKKYNLASFNSHLFYLCSLQRNVALLIRHDFLTHQPLEQTNEGSCAITSFIHQALQRGTYWGTAAWPVETVRSAFLSLNITYFWKIVFYNYINRSYGCKRKPPRCKLCPTWVTWLYTHFCITTSKWAWTGAVYVENI